VLVCGSVRVSVRLLCCWYGCFWFFVVVESVFTSIMGSEWRFSCYLGTGQRAKEQETRERELETRQAQMFMNIYDKTVSKDYGRSYARVL
jgi:hypothetical protein